MWFNGTSEDYFSAFLSFLEFNAAHKYLISFQVTPVWNDKGNYYLRDLHDENNNIIWNSWALCGSLAEVLCLMKPAYVHV